MVISCKTLGLKCWGNLDVGSGIASTSVCVLAATSFAMSNLLLII